MLPLVEIDVDPIITNIGPFPLRWYSVMIMLGVVVGTWLAAKFAERRGLSPDDIYNAALWVLVGGILGARLAHVIDRFDYYRVHPALIPQIYEGGLAIWGGLLAGGLSGWAYTQRYHVPLWKFADSVVHGTILGLAIGRFGCIVNGDVAGKPTDGTWGFVYTNPAALLPKPEYFNTPTWPYPLMEQVWDLAIFGLLFLVWRRAKFDGAVFLAGVILYSIGRFVLTFTREEELFLFGLQQAQVFSLIAIVIAAYLYLYLRGRQPRVSGSAPQPTPAGA